MLNKLTEKKNCITVYIYYFFSPIKMFRCLEKNKWEKDFLWIQKYARTICHDEKESLNLQIVDLHKIYKSFLSYNL